MAAQTRPSSWLTCRNVCEWHDWLVQNHAQAADVWLRIRKVKSPECGVTLPEAGAEAMCFGWVDSKMYSQDEHGFILRFSPRKPGSLWSLLNRNLAETLITEGRMTEAGMSTIRAAQANGRWEAAYTSRRAPDVPADLADVLANDPEAAAGFDRWSNSRQLQFICWIGQSRTKATRQNRIDKVVGSARGEIEI